MRLKRWGREYYRLRLTTSPAVAASAWEASFDDGVTWWPSSVIIDVLGDWSAWLIAGPLAPVGTAVAVVTHDTLPMVRLTDNPEIVVRDAPRVSLT